MEVELSPGVARGGEVADVLMRIVQRRQERFAQPEEGWQREPTGQISKAGALGQRGAFEHALRHAVAQQRTAIIAEVKMGSPKLGDLRDRVDPAAQARLYLEGGASALSVVVEPEFFFGSYDLLRRCVGESGLPAIAKDFVVSERQIDAAAAAGAAAVLLIAALYEPAELWRLAAEVRARGLTPLVETHSVADVRKLDPLGTALRDATVPEPAPWELVGVNNRDLRTFEVDLAHSIELVARLPSGALRVAESGIAGRGEVERLQAAGFDAFLIGESLLLAENPGLVLRQLLGQAGPTGGGAR